MTEHTDTCSLSVQSKIPEIKSSSITNCNILQGQSSSSTDCNIPQSSSFTDCNISQGQSSSSTNCNISQGQSSSSTDCNIPQSSSFTDCNISQGQSSTNADNSEQSDVLFSVSNKTTTKFPEHPYNVAVFGSTDIKLFHRHLKVQCNGNIGLDRRLCMIECWGHENLLVGGDSQNRLEIALSTHRFRNKDLIFLHVGSDDLINHVEPLKVAEDILVFCDKLMKAFHPKCIIISQLINLAPEPYEGFNDKVWETNSRIQSLCFNRTDLSLWRHKFGGVNPEKCLYTPDGKHLTEIGSKRFTRTIRDAILRHIRWYCLP